MEQKKGSPIPLSFESYLESIGFIDQHQADLCVAGQVIDSPFPNGRPQKGPRFPNLHILSVFHHQHVARELSSDVVKDGSRVGFTSFVLVEISVDRTSEELENSEDFMYS